MEGRGTGGVCCSRPLGPVEHERPYRLFGVEIVKYTHSGQAVRMAAATTGEDHGPE